MITEQEWLSRADPTTMLADAQGLFTERKLRLLSCACCRSIWHLLCEDCREAVEICERYVEGKVNKVSLLKVNEFAAAHAIALNANENTDQEILIWAAAKAVANAVKLVESPGHHYVDNAWDCVWSTNRAMDGLRQKELLALIRDVLGNPFRQVFVDPSWRTAKVLGLAQSMYDDSRLGDLPALADALHEAGCTNAKILKHCRNKRSHVRGCWVVDSILCK